MATHKRVGAVAGRERRLDDHARVERPALVPRGHEWRRGGRELAFRQRRAGGPGGAGEQVERVAGGRPGGARHERDRGRSLLAGGRADACGHLDLRRSRAGSDSHQSVHSCIQPIPARLCRRAEWVQSARQGMRLTDEDKADFDRGAGEITVERVDRLAEWLEVTLGTRLSAFAAGMSPRQLVQIAHGEAEPGSETEQRLRNLFAVASLIAGRDGAGSAYAVADRAERGSRRQDAREPAPRRQAPRGGLVRRRSDLLAVLAAVGAARRARRSRARPRERAWAAARRPPRRRHRPRRASRAPSARPPARRACRGSADSSWRTSSSQRSTSRRTSSSISR